MMAPNKKTHPNDASGMARGFGEAVGRGLIGYADAVSYLEEHANSLYPNDEKRFERSLNRLTNILSKQAEQTLDAEYASAGHEPTGVFLEACRACADCVAFNLSQHVKWAGRPNDLTLIWGLSRERSLYRTTVFMDDQRIFLEVDDMRSNYRNMLTNSRLGLARLSEVSKLSILQNAAQESGLTASRTGMLSRMFEIAPLQPETINHAVGQAISTAWKMIRLENACASSLMSLGRIDYEKVENGPDIEALHELPDMMAP